jgi:hypothetical protein
MTLEEIKTQLSVEKQAFKDMQEHQARIPEGWSLDKQDGFQKGMAHVLAMLGATIDQEMLKEQVEAGRNLVTALLNTLEDTYEDYAIADEVLHADIWLRWTGNEGTPEEQAKLYEEIKKDY